MSPPEGAVTSRGLGWRLVLITTLIVVIPFVTSSIVKRAVGAAGYEPTLLAKSADIILEMEKHLITLAAAFVGGLSAFVAARYQSLSRISDRQLKVVAVSGAAGAASLIFGYGTYSTMIWMMSAGIYKPDVLHLLTFGQFWMFIVAVAAFAVFAYREAREAA
jgi:ABC-type multidrug transport system fused ATPase/permease subunit